VAQIMPGPNVVNLSIMLGERYFGWRGAIVGLCGMLTFPMLVVISLTLIYTQFAANPAVAGALRGMGAVAAGLVAGMGLKLAGTLRKHPLGKWYCAGLAIAAFVLVAVLGAFAARLVLRERQLAAEEQALIDLEPQLASIRDAKANWEDLRPALTPEQYPVESIYQLILLLPPEGIRVTRCELRSDGMVIDGEASSLGHGIEFRDKLVAAPAFQRWLWDFPQPPSLPDGRATCRAEARPVESADPNNPEVAVQ